jgi:hypothetical protein
MQRLSRQESLSLRGWIEMNLLAGAAEILFLILHLMVLAL